MSRLFDRVKASYPSSFKELPKIVVAPNVSDYFFEGTDKERWDLSEDFPNCVPPFKNLWGGVPSSKRDRLEGARKNKLALS